MKLAGFNVNVIVGAGFGVGVKVSVRVGHGVRVTVELVVYVCWLTVLVHPQAIKQIIVKMNLFDVLLTIVA